MQVQLKLVTPSKRTPLTDKNTEVNVGVRLKIVSTNFSIELRVSKPF